MSFITLFHIEIFAILAAILGFACTVVMAILRLKFTFKTDKHVREVGIDGIDVENTRITNIYKRFLLLAMMFFVLALIAITVHSYIFTKAIKYGAYGDFNKKNTLADIKYNIDNGFIDQSAEVPDDPKGCVIIFFKWGCPDCANIHDELTATLKDYDLYKTYFVSSRSDRGQQLLAQYPVSEVPSGIFIYYQNTDGLDYQSKILYDDTKLNTYNLDTLLSVQTYIRCFELPAEYAQDAPDKIPEEYTQTYEENADETPDDSNTDASN
jgi:hypothetical protein